MRPHIFLLSLLVTCSFFLNAALTPFSVIVPSRKAVLLLFPYQPDLPQTVLAQKSIQAELNGSADLTIDWYYEYLDLNRFPSADYRNQLVELYASKYRGRNIDLVFATSEQSLNFWLQYRGGILPNTPTVFYDILPERLAVYKLPTDVTGIASTLDSTQYLNWVVHLSPPITEIVVVQGVSEADRGFNTPMSDLQDNLDGQVLLTDWSVLSLDEVKRRAATLPPGTIIFYQLMLEDSAGVKYRPIDALRELVGVSAVPVISKYDQFIGVGTIGGYMYSIELVAREAARMGARILRGEAVSNIPVVSYQSNHFIFDHLALQRWNIPLSALPAQSVIKNRQYTIWEQYRLQLIGVSAVIIGLIFMISLLGVLTKRLNTARRDLSRINDNLETQVRERIVAYRQLEEEIVERKQVEEDLKEANEHLEYQLNEIKTLQESLREQAIRDPLTGLYNRRYLQETMEREFARARRENYMVSVMMMDIDHFKNFNDAHGHQAGDEVLIAHGNLLKNSVRQGDIAFRYGGEEFIVIMPNVDAVDAARRADTMRSDFSAFRIDCEGVEFGVTISVGIAFYPQHGGDMNEIIKAADAALYEAKQSGRNRVIVWNQA
jgi:diguanylate cyclase (GGDEF)-like protein